MNLLRFICKINNVVENARIFGWDLQGAKFSPNLFKITSTYSVR